MNTIIKNRLRLLSCVTAFSKIHSPITNRPVRFLLRVHKAAQYRLASVLYVCAYGFVGTIMAHCLEDSDKKKKSGVSAQDVANLLKQSDEYFTATKVKESLDVIYELRSTKDAEVLWRICRGLYNLTKNKKMKDSEKQQHILEAYGYIEEALTLDPNNFAVHKYKALLVDAKANCEGTKARIEALPTFKLHLMKAIELNPKDATSLYMLGQYCYSITAMPWYQRKIASALFAKPPESTFEEALQYFSKAEEVDPNFYSMNLLMLGKTYQELGKPESARYWLQCASNYPARTEEDDNARQEAIELLKKLPAPKK